MDETIHERKLCEKQGEMKRVSDKRKLIVAIPPVVEPVKVEFAVAGIAPKIDDVTVTVRVEPICIISPIPPPLECSRGCIEFGISTKV